jgi:Flp pilus assembly secretin CpaC
MQQSNTELLVLVTPRLVKPMEPGAQPENEVEFPKEFIDIGKFDEEGRKWEPAPAPKDSKE